MTDWKLNKMSSRQNHIIYKLQKYYYSEEQLIEIENILGEGGINNG